MRPRLETLEPRNVPGMAYNLVPLYGAVADYPVAPAGQQVVTLQDAFNVASPFAQFHPTPLMPVPPATFNLWVDMSILTERLNEWSVPQPGGDAFGYMATADWLAVQHDLYSFDTSTTTDPAFWTQWLANVQTGVAIANAELFAAQDAFWAAQSPVPQNPIGNPIQEPLAADSLIVEALLSLEGTTRRR
jgi:hypothetical protein